MTAPNRQNHASEHVPNADIYLVYELERRAYPLGRTFTIGRDTDSDLVVLEPTVSRTHARITELESGYVLENVGPTGTRVNGERLEASHQLAYGDRIEIGTAVLTVRTAPLPLGVTTAAKPQGRILDAVAARRATIRHPLMSERVIERRPAWGKWVAVAVAIAVMAAMFLRG